MQFESLLFGFKCFSHCAVECRGCILHTSTSFFVVVYFLTTSLPFPIPNFSFSLSEIITSSLAYTLIKVNAIAILLLLK